MINRISLLVRAMVWAALVWLGAAIPAAAQDQRAIAAITEALTLMRAGDWPGALAAAGAEGSVARDIIEWHRLRASKGSFSETRAFLQRRPDWPGLALLRERSEQSIPPGAPTAQVLEFFAAEPPQTGFGALRMAEALRNTGAVTEAEAQIVLAWFSMTLSAAEEAEFLATYGESLKPYHWQRLDMLLWRGASKEADRLLPLVGSGQQTLARARLALRAQANGVDGLIAAVPASLADDPGLAYERFLWRASKGRNQDAVDLLLARSGSAASLGDPGRWASWRRVLARWLMREGKAPQAYQLAARHQLAGGDDFNDLEWLAGYIALRKLNDPAKALGHFQTFRNAVESPISLGRAGYWEGRAYEALGDKIAAQAAYAFGGEFQTSFYGLLAAEKAGLAMDPNLTGREKFAGWEQAGFWNTSTMQATRLLQAADERYLALRFSQQLSESLNREQNGQLTAWAESVDAPYLQVKLAKYVLNRGILLERPYFAVTDLDAPQSGVPREFILAIARRESEFNPTVVSGVGARGLMQLMPGTAKDMAEDVGVEFSKAKLLTDPDYNLRLGTEYLAYLFEEFGNNPVLVAVAYNAGPGRARSWSGQMGHPGARNVDVVDWIEHIPFRETQNYVMRVTESLPIYRARLSGKTAPLRLSAELKAR